MRKSLLLVILASAGMTVVLSLQARQAPGLVARAYAPRPVKKTVSGVCPPFKLKDEDGNVIDPVQGVNANRPYSPKKTCGECHDYQKITQGYHFTQGKGEPPTLDQAARCQWASSPGNYGGTWCSPAPLYRYLSPKRNETARTIDLTSFTFLTAGCAKCHPGGGSAEFDRTGKRYDQWMRDPQSGLTSGGENDLDGDYYQARWSETGVLEADCLICHQPGYDLAARNGQVASENFRWAATAGSGLGLVKGSIKAKDPIEVVYDPARFAANGTARLHIVRRPRSEACLGCHDKPGWKKRGANYRPATDVHARAGLTCVDCHPAGSSAEDPCMSEYEQHEIGKGDDPGGHVRDVLDDTCLTCVDCHETGRKGAPVPRHEGLPTLHLERITCQACHVPERTIKAAHFVASDVFNPGTRIPSKGKHLWTFYGPDLTYWNHYGELVLEKYDDKPRFSYPPELIRYKGKIYPANRVHTAWPGIETDGQSGLMQPKMGDVYKMWAAHRKDPSSYPRLAEINDDNGDGVVEVNRPSEIDALIASVSEMLKKTSYPMEGKRVVWVLNDRVHSSGTVFRQIEKHPWEASPYGNVHTLNHDIAPARAALGTNGCVECHRLDSAFFFTQVARYPLDEKARPVFQPQHEVLGLSGFFVVLGALREAYLKPLVHALLLLLACAAAGLVTSVVQRRRGLAPVLVFLGGGGLAIWVLADPSVRHALLPSRSWLDAHHALLAILVLALGLIAALHDRESSAGGTQGPPPRAARVLFWSLGVGAVAGGLMLLDVSFLSGLTRLSYTVFELSLALILAGTLVRALGSFVSPPNTETEHETRPASPEGSGEGVSS